MSTQTLTAGALLKEWQQIRNEWKRADAPLNAPQTAGLLIEELGSAYAALRLVQVSQEAPAFVGLENPSRYHLWEVRDLLTQAYVVEAEPAPPTAAELQQAWEERPEGLTAQECTDAKLVAGALLEEQGGNVHHAMQVIGIGLYSRTHEVQGFSAHPLAREALFWLDLASRIARAAAPEA